MIYRPLPRVFWTLYGPYFGKVASGFKEFVCKLLTGLVETKGFEPSTS